MYEGRFNWYGEVHMFFRWAKTEARAKQLMLLELSKKLGVDVIRLRGYFSDANKYVIQVIKE